VSLATRFSIIPRNAVFDVLLVTAQSGKDGLVSKVRPVAITNIDKNSVMSTNQNWWLP
jgi:hypothetical protein